MSLVIVNGQITTPTGFRVQAQSYKSLEKIAAELTMVLTEAGAVCEDKIDCISVLENILPKSEYDYHYAEDEEMHNSAAFTIPEKKLVVLARSVYEGLFDGNVFSRSTVIHELSHIVLEHHLTLHRGSPAGTHKHCEDSEWQAKALTAAVMMPIKVVKEVRMNSYELAEVCGTSNQAAIYRINNIEKYRLLDMHLN